MSATDELRRMLDERVVEWRDLGCNDTSWKSKSGILCKALLRHDRESLYVRVYGVTPNQAIDATLGRGTCKMVVDNHHRVDNVTTSWGCVCSACGGFQQYTHGEKWAYCPNCGAKVVRE